MSTAATRTRKPFLHLGLSPEKGNEVIALLLAFAVVLLAASLLSYHPLDPSVLHRVADENARTHNLIGPFGAQMAAVCFSFFGLTSLVLPVFLAAVCLAASPRARGPQRAGPRPGDPGAAARPAGDVATPRGPDSVARRAPRRRRSDRGGGDPRS